MISYLRSVKILLFILLPFLSSNCRTLSYPKVQKIECQAVEQVAKAAEQPLISLDEKMRLKILDHDLIDIYDQIIEQTSLIRSGKTNTVGKDSCIPVYIDLLITFNGNIGDLKACGLSAGNGIRSSEGVHILEGRIDPIRFGKLAAISHIISIRTLPKAHPELPNK